MTESLGALLSRIRQCELCKANMQRAPRPVLQASETARVLVVGQAPGNLAANSGIPFSDPSGDRLRAWMGVTSETFYDASRIAVVPMGFCFPGYDAKGGDLPPMKECAPAWRSEVLGHMKSVKVTVIVGTYAQKWHLGSRRSKTLTETVSRWQEFASEGLFTLPHPSWRNTAWLKKNPWVEHDILPALQNAISSALSASR